jgi:hypothetical protein
MPVTYGITVPVEGGDILEFLSGISVSNWGNARIRGMWTPYDIPRDPDDETSPQVSNVVIGSTTSDDTYSFAAHDGAGDQFAPITVRRADTISLVFSEDVYVAEDALTLSGAASSPTVSSFVVDDNIATWTFTEPFNPDDFEILLDDERIYDSNYNLLDGEWENQTDTFNSGDDTAGGDFVFDFVVGTPPQIQTVIIASTVTNTYGTNPPYDFNAANADGSGEQLRTVPVGGADKISIQFTEDVQISSGDLSLISLNRVVSVPSVNTFVEPSSGNNYTATWTYSSKLPGAQYALRLPDSIQNLQGTYLDGEWTNPSALTTTGTHAFPSGDGNDVAGGNFDFVFTIMPGDANRDLRVNFDDYSVLYVNYSQSGRGFQDGDFTGDGTVSFDDFQVLFTMYNLDWRILSLLGDYDENYVLDEDDETAFLSYYNSNPPDMAADLDGDSDVDQDDYDAFYERFQLIGSDLHVVV